MQVSENTDTCGGFGCDKCPPLVQKCEVEETMA